MASTLVQKNCFIFLSLLFVLAIQDALFYGLWKQLISSPERVVTLFADFVFTPAVAAPPKPGSASAPEIDLRQKPVGVAPPNQIPTDPVVLTSELSTFCYKLDAPIYPSDSRRLCEEGKVLIRVELDTKWPSR